MVDGTECPVSRPLDSEAQLFWYSGEAKTHTIKYEIAVEMKTGLIRWLAGGEPGRIHDLTLSRLSNLLKSGASAIADKAYQDPFFVTPFKGPWESLTAEQQGYNTFINKHRVIVENTFGRMKIFRAVRDIWRHDLELHPYVFVVVANITNILIQKEPLRNE